MEDLSALIIIDVQNDFCQGGALPVPEGNKVIPVLNRYLALFSKNKQQVIATRDWHPQVTKHFKQFGGQWPSHCVQNTWGAQFHPDLQLPTETVIISAGMSEDKQGYSGFEGVDPKGKSLYDVLKSKHTINLLIGGLATEYCVKMTVLDALEYGFKVKLLIDAIKGINVKPNDSQEAINEMVLRGAHPTTIDSISIRS